MVVCAHAWYCREANLYKFNETTPFIGKIRGVVLYIKSLFLAALLLETFHCFLIFLYKRIPFIIFGKKVEFQHICQSRREVLNFMKNVTGLEIYDRELMESVAFWLSDVYGKN